MIIIKSDSYAAHLEKRAARSQVLRNKSVLVASFNLISLLNSLVRCGPVQKRIYARLNI